MNRKYNKLISLLSLDGCEKLPPRMHDMLMVYIRKLTGLVWDIFFSKLALEEKYKYLKFIEQQTLPLLEAVEKRMNNV